MAIGRTNAATLSSGTGAFDLVKVTAYTPYEAALTAPSSVVVSGLTTIEVMGEEQDISAFNGTYNVVVAREATLKKRVYKHSMQNYYLYYYPGDEYEPWNIGWCLSSNTSYGIMSATLYNQNIDQLSSGTITWYNEMGGSASVTLAVTNTSYPEIMQVLQGAKATNYNVATKVWSFDNTTLDFATFEKTPKYGSVYVARESSLVGNLIAMAEHRSVMEVTAANTLLCSNGREYYKKYDGIAIGGGGIVDGFSGPVLVSSVKNNAWVGGGEYDTGEPVAFDYYGDTFYRSGGENWNGGTMTLHEGFFDAGARSTVEDVAIAILDHYFYQD